MSRERPNFLVTGTPGVGKTTFSQELAQRMGMIHIPVSQLIAEKHLWEERDDERDCTIYSESLLDEEIENIIEGRSLYTAPATPERRIFLTEDNKNYYVSCAMPIFTEGDVIGCVASIGSVDGKYELPAT